jgi:DNA topoisomerase I
VDEAGNRQDVTSTDVNEYLKEITGKEITAKDFRTWAGTVLAAMALNELESFDSAAQAKRNLRAAIEKVAGRLGNTPTICRKCYVHPEVLNSYMDGNLVLELKSQAENELRNTVQQLKPEEAAVLALLRGRLDKETKSRMPEIGTSGSMSGDGKRGAAEWPKLPRPSSTLPTRPISLQDLTSAFGAKRK